MSKHDYVAQARFWAREYRRRTPRLLASAVPPRTNSAIIHALEARARPRDLTLGTGFPRATEIVAATHELAASVPVRVPPNGPLPEDVFYFPPVRVHELKDVTLDIDSGLLFARDWVVNGSGTGQRAAMDSAFITGAAVRAARGGHAPEPRVVAPLANVIEHYHFLMETLPQVLRIRQVAPDAVFLASETPGSSVRAILDLLAVRYEIVERGRVVECAHVLFCEGFPRERTHPADMQALVDSFVGLRSDDDDSSEKADRVYISRRGSLRSLAGEELLEAWLADRGFAILRLEDLPFDEQVRALSDARLVVAPHGGGLANTVFMPAGGTVIELATGEWWSNAFRRIAHVRGHEYSLVAMTSTPEARWGAAEEAIGLLEPMIERR